MNENNFEKLKQEAFFGIEREGVGVIVGNYIFNKDELSALLEAWDESKWKEYPESMPDVYRLYDVSLKNGDAIQRWYFIETERNYGWDDVIAFKIPKPFKQNEK